MRKKQFERVDHSGGKPSWRRVRMDSRKNSGRDKMMPSKAFETQEVREISRKEAG